MGFLHALRLIKGILLNPPPHQVQRQSQRGNGNDHACQYIADSRDMLAALPQRDGFKRKGREGRKAAKDASRQKQARVLSGQMRSCEQADNNAHQGRADNVDEHGSIREIHAKER